MTLHLPNFEGYHAQRFEIVKECVRTMREGAGLPHSFMIWDNDSHPTVREWICDEVKPDIYIQSINVGKNQARRAMSAMLPADTILNCSDDDMAYSPNWLQPQIDILNNFPNVAAVSGYVVRTSFRWGNENTKAWAKAQGILKSGKILTEDSEREFCKSIGRDYEVHKSTTANDYDYFATYNGYTAFLTAHHCQVLGRAGVLASASKDDYLAMGEERDFDIALDKSGLRLGTMERLVRHIGNIPD